MKPLGLKETSQDQRKHYRLAALSEHKCLKVCQTKTSLSLCGPFHTSPDHGEFLLIHFSFVIFSLHSMSSPRIHHLSKYDPKSAKSSCPHFSRSGFIGTRHHTSNGFKSDFWTFSHLGHIFSHLLLFNCITHSGLNKMISSKGKNDQ